MEERIMAIIGLIIGLGFDPSPTDFEELLAKGAIKQKGFQYVTAELSIEEASDRNKLKQNYMAACINQNWEEGLAYADDLKFSDVVVFGKSVVIVEPKGFDEPEAKPGGIIAGIGFTPAQADLNLLAKQIKLQPGHEYVLKSYSKSDASSETFLATAYLTVAKQQGWAPLSGSLSIQRRKINGKDFLMVQPSPPDETIEEGKKAAQTGPVTQSEKLIELFNREKIDPSGKKILAFAILYEREVAPAVWVGPGPDPDAAISESPDAKQARFLGRKIIPGYQPQFIPAHLTIDADTFVAGRPLRKGESLEVAHINQVLAVMLTDLLADQDLNNCTALSLSGESVALGQNRFAIVVGEEETTHREIVNADVELPHDEEFEQMITDLENPDEEVRKAAIMRLGEIGNQRAVAPLMAAFKDDELAVVWAAESALAKIGSPAYETLITALHNDEAGVRKGAARTLGKFGDPQAVEPLIAALKDDDKDVRMSVVTALGKIGDDRAVEPLCLALKDKWDVGVCAAEALGKFGDDRAVEPLIDAIKHEDWALWKYAAISLGQIGDPRAVPVLKELRRDTNTQISQAAADGLEAIKKKQEASPVRASKKTDQTIEQGAGTAAIVKELNQPIERYEKAVNYLDQCDKFEFEDLLEAHRIAGTNTPESELREMWSLARYVLPGPDHPGGVESLRKITRDAFTASIADLNKIVGPSAAGSAAPPVSAGVKVPAKPTPARIKKPAKAQRRPAWVWLVGILAVVVYLGWVGMWFWNRSSTSPPSTSDVVVEQPKPETPVEDPELGEVAEEVQPVQPNEAPAPIVVAEEPIQVEPEGGFGYLERAMAGEFAGTVVNVLGRVTDQEVELFDESVRDFQDMTGIRVVYDSNNEFDSILRALVAAGDPPDIADMPQPSLLTSLVSDGEVVDVSQFLDIETLEANYNQAWLDLATMESPDGPIMAGVWHRATNKSIVWYPKKEFEAVGYEVPTTWDDLMELSQQIADEGGTAWCIGMESSSATGWVATDWVENILIRTNSTDIYDQWVVGELPFSSPEVTRAVEIMSDIWFNEDYVYGGKEAILTTTFYESPIPLFDDPPGCWLHLQGPWITLHFPDDLEPGVDYDFFTLPPIEETFGSPIIIYGNIMTMFNDRPEVRALMEYFSTGESAEAWVRAGAAISPHNDSSLNWYTNDTDRHIAETILDADTVRFDASDMMPPEVAYGSFWAGMTDYVSGTDLSTVLEAIDQSWPGAPLRPAAETGKQVVLIPHPDCPQPTITSADDIVVRVRWGASSLELAESNANHFTFVFLLDGEEIDDIRPYRQPAETYSGLDDYGCGPSQPASWVHWDVPLGQLSAGTHTVAVEHILDETISDGIDTYPAGSLGRLETSFEVQP